MSSKENLRNRKPNKNDEKNTSSPNSAVDDKLGKYIKILFGLSAASAIAVFGVLAYFYIPHLLLLVSDDSDTWNPSFDPEAVLPTETKKYTPSEDHGPEYIHYPWVVDEVPRVKWDPEKPFAEIFAELDRPVILYNTVVDKWKAMSRWTPDYIVSKTPMLAKVQKHKDKTFSYFHEDHPMSALPGIVGEYKQGTYERVNMSSKDFFEKITKTPPYHYFAGKKLHLFDFNVFLGNADSLGEPYADLHPIEPLIVKNESFKIEESHLNRWTNVWFGPAGATTHTHYDKGAQQSQVRFEKPDYKNFPRFKNARALDAVLHPGDVLYLPPLWFHHVSALTNSMSVSIWSKFNETQVMYKTVRSPLPFKKSWPQRKMHLAGRLYLEMLFDKLYGKGTAKPFVSQIFEQRYNLLDKQFPELFQTEQTYCLEDMFPFKAEQILEESGEDFDTFSDELKEYFLKSKNDARRNIWLGNFCEQLGLTVAGIQNVGRFLLDFTRC